jgi:hypothetical protein
MKISRRNFVWGTAMAGSTPTLVNFKFPFSSVLSHAALPSGSSAPQPTAGGGDASRVVFKINGWERENMAIFDKPEIASAKSASNASLSQPIWIGVTQSWRATWR